MDRKRDRKNACCSYNKVKKYAFFSIFASIGLLPSCTQQNRLINQRPSQIKPQYYNHIPKGRTVLNMQQRFAGILNVHNRIRSKHQLAPLKWSEHLAEYSLEWAKHLGNGNQCKMYHRGGKPPYGENLYFSSAEVWRDQNGREVDRRISPVTITEVVNSWASEEKWYNYSRNRCQSGKQCGHYTQIVWRNTTEVGCAMKVCPDKSQTWVCSYNPPGNFVGERPY